MVDAAVGFHEASRGSSCFRASPRWRPGYADMDVWPRRGRRRLVQCSAGSIYMEARRSPVVGSFPCPARRRCSPEPHPDDRPRRSRGSTCLPTSTHPLLKSNRGGRLQGGDCTFQGRIGTK